jgi:hypothetical protein
MALRAQMDMSTPVDVINYALTLEHLEAAFYRDGLNGFTVDDFVAAGFDPLVVEYLALAGQQEADHVAALTAVVEQLGGEPVAEGEYDFGYTDVASFLATAAAIENTGVSAYQGAAGSLIDEDELLTAALAIHGVEARHAAYLNGLTGTSPFPEAVNPTLTPDEVLEIVTPFLVS